MEGKGEGEECECVGREMEKGVRVCVRREGEKGV